jgi:hypothetical protein
MKYLSILFITAFLFTFAAQTSAADFTVNLTTDQHDASVSDLICDIDLGTPGEQCTLRAATEQKEYTSFPLNHRILFDLPANSVITLTTANGGELNVDYIGTMQIIGTGANNLTVVGGAGDNRILYTYRTNLTVSGVTLTGGGGVGIGNKNGGAIQAGGPLTLDGVHVTGNSIAGDTGGGGGVIYFGGGTSRIINSTFSNNSAMFGGGFWNAFGTLTIINSTISGNTAGVYGAGFLNSGNATLRNVTITGNTAKEVGGGIFTENGTLNLGNTIVAGNTASFSLFSDIRFQDDGVVISAGYNLIGDSSGDSTNTYKPIAYQPTDFRDVNPLFGALQNNGGRTPTHALLAGSPAINAGNNSDASATDQRGFNRIAGGIIDIGAFEFASGKSSKRVRFF